MQAFLTVATILGLTALFSYTNERFLRLQQTIGLMVLALGFTLVLMLMTALGLTDAFADEQAFVTRLSLGYGLAEHLEVSGPIAMVVTGLVVGNYSMPRLAEQQRAPFETFWQAIDEVLNAMLFVVIGLHIAIVPQDSSLMLTATIAVMVCLAARWISVYLPLNALSIGALKADRLGLTNLLTWGGLRGGLAVAMAMSLPDGPEKAVILHMTYGVVAFSIIVQGLTISRFFKADQLKGLLRQ